MSDGGVCRCKLRKRENDPHREGEGANPQCTLTLWMLAEVDRATFL